MQPNIIPLESIQIATPCRANWDAMQLVQGTNGVRFCPSCSKNVYNLSAMSRDEAVRLIREKEGDMCVRLYRRSDGTVITNDCPVGESASQKSQIARMFALFIGLATALFGMSYVKDNRSNNAPKFNPSLLDGFGGATMGAMEASVPPQGQSQVSPQLPSTFPTPIDFGDQFIIH